MSAANTTTTLNHSPYRIRMHSKTSGFSLIELLITLVIAAITLGYAIPSAYSSIQYAQFRSSIENSASLLQYARTQALQGQWIGLKTSDTLPNTLEVYQINNPSSPLLLKTLTLNKRYLFLTTAINPASASANPRYTSYPLVLSPHGHPPHVNTLGQGINGVPVFYISLSDGKATAGQRSTYRYTGTANMSAGGTITKTISTTARPTAPVGI